MENRLKAIIQARVIKIEDLINKSEEKISKLPKGRINVRKIGERSYYYHCETGVKEKYLGNKDDKLLNELMQKFYLSKLISISKKELYALKKMKQQCPELIAEDVYSMMPDDRKPYIRPIILTDEQYISEWQNRPYDKKPISDDVPRFETLRGERVRSKSEVIIADRLFFTFETANKPLDVRVLDKMINDMFK